jgi:hypothetical protein
MDYIPMIEVGMLLYSLEEDSWARVIFDKTREKGDQIGIKFLDSFDDDDYEYISEYWGPEDSGLNENDFGEYWRLAGSYGCPSVPKWIDYEPPSNQGRDFCFWHPRTKLKDKYVKEIDVVFNYCPKCKR